MIEPGMMIISPLLPINGIVEGITDSQDLLVKWHNGNRDVIRPLRVTTVSRETKPDYLVLNR